MITFCYVSLDSFASGCLLEARRSQVFVFKWSEPHASPQVKHIPYKEERYYSASAYKLKCHHFLKGRLKLQNGISEQKECLPFASIHQAQATQLNHPRPSL